MSVIFPARAVDTGVSDPARIEGTIGPHHRVFADEHRRRRVSPQHHTILPKKYAELQRPILYWGQFRAWRIHLHTEKLSPPSRIYNFPGAGD